jgi:hypothetical protein
MWQRSGVGGHLVAEAELLARRLDLRRTMVATTNDNLPALYFYQRRGYRLTDLVPNSITVPHRPGSRRVRRHSGARRGAARKTTRPVTSIPRTLGRWDLVLLKIVAIVNINNVPAVAVYGRKSLALWVLAFVCFFVPEAIAGRDAEPPLSR